MPVISYFQLFKNNDLLLIILIIILKFYKLNKLIGIQHGVIHNH